MTTLRTVPADVLFARMATLDGRIAERAHALARERGAPSGFGVDDWFRAETELSRPLHIRCTDSERQVAVSAEVPGASPESIEVGVEGRALVVSIRAEPGACRTVELPSRVELARASLRFEKGVLELLLPKHRGTPQPPVGAARA